MNINDEVTRELQSRRPADRVLLLLLGIFIIHLGNSLVSITTTMTRPDNTTSCSSPSSCFMVLIARFLLLAAFLSLVQGQILYTANEDKRNFDRDFMHFGKRAAVAPVEMERHFMNFGKREQNFDRNFMPFGKRYVPLEEAVRLDKKNFDREFLHFGKRAPSNNAGFERDFMTFGKRDPSSQGFERDFMTFGKRK
uniref:Uncharacterized protein n=1 Tax=Ditylenchus dipsaci TaxID=166011 RepID=A0A915E8P0_9BILA